MQLLRGQQPSGRLGASEQAQLVQFMTSLQSVGAGAASAGVHPAFSWPLPAQPLGGCIHFHYCVISKFEKGVRCSTPDFLEEGGGSGWGGYQPTVQSTQTNNNHSR